MKLRLAALALLPLALAACDETAMRDFQAGLGMKTEAEAEPVPLDQLQPPEVSPLQQPIEVAGGKQGTVATADAETYRTEAFVARGNEPFWNIEVADGKALYRTPENQNGRTINVRRIVFASGVEYVGTLGGSVFALTIRGTDCQDDMSGEKFPMSAVLKIGNRVTQGCAAPAKAAAEG